MVEARDRASGNAVWERPSDETMTTSFGGSSMTSSLGSCAPAVAAPIAWRLRVDGPLSGAENMRVDEELLALQRTPGALPVLRFFLWWEPTVSYGRLQSPEKVLDRARPLGDTDKFVRRPTGGGLVRHDKDLSLSLAWRRDHSGFPRCLKDIYRALHETVRTALRELGVETALHIPKGRNGGGRGVCFAEPVEDDLLLGGRKVLGGALRVTGWGRLYQGTILPETARVAPDILTARLAIAFGKIFFKTPPSTTAGDDIQNLS